MARRDIIDLTNDDKTSVTSDEGRLPHRLSRRAHRASQSRDPPLASVSTTPKRKRKAHQLHDHLTISSGDDTKIVSADDSRPASGVPTRVKSHELQPARKKTRTPSDQPSPTKGQDLAASTKRQPGLTTTLHESINSAKTSNRRIGVVSNETVLENDAAPIASTDSSTRLRDATVNRSKVSEAEEVGIARIDTVNPSKHLRNAVANPLRVSEAAAARLADTAMVYSSRLINYDDRISHKTSILSGEGGPRVVEEDATSPKEVTQVRSFDAVDTANADSNQGAHEVESTEQRRTVPIVNRNHKSFDQHSEWFELMTIRHRQGRGRRGSF
ncbi:hypothetical protein EJ05DRAFT_118113 [Pseudovirgaria hyperparasitica]|uniref:Uncharacterized protein n=1 Tax=Pseudovirgaria hyperparasitica TaxID=470096 RepID=A0A6A6VWK2_9PEZI|nr:uncharacterized protein EJ05DRAFT_118113 [Pseudovirgaria hyperparasitica]KAF2754972.1 hypothetical protein EJ05DRAFT_118113 [Pseudovirgaria hyperparasitica]